MNIRNLVGTISQCSQTNTIFTISGIIPHKFEETRVAWQTIMIRTFNPKNHEHLIQRRIKRLTKLFLYPLGLCHLEVKLDRLMVHCTEAWMVDNLMDDLEYLSETARIIVGTPIISLHFAQEEICRTTTKPHLPIAS